MFALQINTIQLFCFLLKPARLDSLAFFPSMLKANIIFSISQHFLQLPVGSFITAFCKNSNKYCLEFISMFRS